MDKEKLQQGLNEYEDNVAKSLAKLTERKNFEAQRLYTPLDIEDFDYDEVPSLRIEARQKLKLYKPLSIGQASRISGVSPADISVLLVYMEQMKYHKGNIK